MVKLIIILMSESIIPYIAWIVIEQYIPCMYINTRFDSSSPMSLNECIKLPYNPYYAVNFACCAFMRHYHLFTNNSVCRIRKIELYCQISLLMILLIHRQHLHGYVQKYA